MLILWKKTLFLLYYNFLKNLSNLQKPKFSDLSYDHLNLFQASMWLSSLIIVMDIALQVY